MSALSAIEAEWGQSFADLYASFRMDNLSNRLIADIFRVPESTLNAWIHRAGICDGRKINVPGKQDKRKLDYRCQQLGFEGVADAIRDYRMRNHTVKELAETLESHPGSLYRHVPDEIKGQTVYYDGYKDDCRRGLAKARETMMKRYGTIAPNRRDLVFGKQQRGH